MDDKNKSNLAHFIEIINGAYELQYTHRTYFIDNNIELITEFLSLSKTRNNEIIRNNIKVASEFLSLFTNREVKNEKESCDFNIFEIFAPAEKTHSYILANLLNPYAEHG